jgi:putative nucleotidyltransferase with HDIG domain
MQTCKNIILTGPPGSGKTTLLKRFKGLAKIVDEVAREVIKEWDRGNKWGKGKDIQDEIYKRTKREVERVTDEEWAVFDRTHIDCLAYGYVPEEAPETIENAEVWVLKFHPEWYKNDPERKETPEQAIALGERLKAAYKDLGYTVREIDAADPSTWPKWARKRLERRRASMKEAAIAERVFLASMAERELEKLLKVILPRSPFRGKVFAVGGYVRDEVMGVESKDLDAVIDMKGGAKKMCEWLHAQFPDETSRAHPVKKGYPIWAVHFKDDVTYKGKLYRTDGAEIEVADAQKESFPDEGSRQRITEPGTLAEDNQRRDFTVNMLLKDMTTGELKDMTGQSVADIKKGILRGHPGVNFETIIKQDPLRMLRLVRFQAKYGWKVPYDVLKTVKANASRLAIVSGNRIRGELEKLAKIGKLARGIKMMKVLGLLKYALPEIDAMRGVQHDTSRGHHQEGDVFKHTLLVLKNAKPGIENQFAALLHDVGKPKTQEILEDKITFLGHETVGGEIAEAVLRRLGFHRSVFKKIRTMVESHMRPHHLGRGKPGAKALRKFVREVGEETYEAVLDLAEADQLGNLPPENLVPELRKYIEEAQKVPLKEKEILDGHTIMRILGLKRGGPEVGRAMRWLKEKEDEAAGRGDELTPKEAERLLETEYEPERTASAIARELVAVAKQLVEDET